MAPAFAGTQPLTVTLGDFLAGEDGAITVTASDPIFSLGVAADSLPYPGVNRSVDFHISGSGFSAPVVEAAWVDEIPCASAVVESMSSMRCIGVHSPYSWSNPVFVSLKVKLKGVVDRFDGGLVVRSYPNPSISVANTVVRLSTLEGGVISLEGQGFGLGGELVSSVLLCDQQLPRSTNCSTLDRIESPPSFCPLSGEQLLVKVPPGIGTCPVVAVTSVGTRSDDGLLRVDLPTVTYSPPVVLNVSHAGGDAARFLYGESIAVGDWANALVVCAENLPPLSLDAPTVVHIDGSACGQVR